MKWVKSFVEIPFFVISLARDTTRCALCFRKRIEQGAIERENWNGYVATLESSLGQKIMGGFEGLRIGHRNGKQRSKMLLRGTRVRWRTFNEIRQLRSWIGWRDWASGNLNMQIDTQKIQILFDRQHETITRNNDCFPRKKERSSLPVFNPSALLMASGQNSGSFKRG